MNPGCENVVEYRFEGSGRQQMFCSARCRTQHNASRRALTAEVNNIETLIAHEKAAGRKAVEFERQLTHARWHLARYGGPITE